MTTLNDTLNGVRLRIARGWTQRTYALDESSRPVPSTSPDAVRWCLAGALFAVCALEDGDYRQAEERLAPFVLGQSLSAWNDAPGRTQADVLGLLDAASV